MSTTRRLLVGIAVASVVVLVALAALELAARIAFDRNGLHFGVEMWKYAKELKRESANYAMGHEHVPNSEAVLMRVPVEINSLGLRERELDVEKPENVYRILILGDSMTFGWGARVEDAYPKVLEAMLNEARGPGDPTFEVINAGVGNYNTVQEVAYFEERGVQLDPDMVVIGFYINDAEPTPRAKAGFLTRHSYLFVVGASAWDALGWRGGEKKGYEQYYLDLYRDDAAGWRDARSALRTLIETCEQRGVALRILMIPELHSPAESYPFEKVHETVRRLGAEHGVPVVETRQSMKGIDPPDLWVSLGDAHPNALAHKLIAEDLYEAISGELLNGARPTRAQTGTQVDDSEHAR